MEEDFVIELEESNVQRIINDVKIIEERFNENSEIRLNKDQILIELTNLLNDASKLKSSLIEHKAYRFHDLLFAASDPQQKEGVSHIQGHYTPLVDVLKNIMLTESDEVIDPDYEFENDVKMAFQESVLKQFVNLGKNGSWTTAMPKIQLLMNPWTPKGATSTGVKTTFETSKDVIRNGVVFTRTIAGDEMHVQGVVISGDLQAKNTLTFDIHEYFTTLESLEEGQKVIVCFNDFFEDVNDDRCTHQTVVSKVIAGRGVQLSAPNVFIPFKAYSPVWVFPHKSSQYFNKRDVPKYRQCTLLFSSALDFKSNLAFAVPLSASECIFMNAALVKTLPNLKWVEKTILEPYSFTLDDLDYVTLSRIKKWLNVNDASDPETYKLRTGFSGPEDKIPQIDLLETLLKWRTYIETKEGLFTSAQLSKKRDEITARIHKLETLLKKIKSDEVCKSADKGSHTGRIAMRVDSYDALMESTKSKASLYFQKPYDPTPYEIKESILRENPKLTDEALKSKVYDALQERFPKMSQADLQFERNAIIKGKRKVRFGDIAVLSVPGANLDIAFQYTEINGEAMWVKTFKTAFNMCDAEQNTCIFDTYDELCRSLEYAKANHELKTLYQQQDLLKDKTSSLSLIDELINKFTVYRKLVYSRSKPIVASIVEEDPEDDYFGDANYVDVDALFGNIENYDGEFAVLYQPKDEDAKKKEEPTKELAALQFLSELLGIDTTENEKNEIAMYAAKECSEHYQEVDKAGFIKKKFDASVNKTLYAKEAKYRTKVDKLILDKYEAEVVKNNREYFYHVILYMTAFLSALVMARYPRLVMTSVVSSCSNMLSYVGFPVKPKGYPTSIHNYMACVLIKTSLPDDDRLSKFFESTQEKIREALETQMEKIMSTHGKLAERIEQNKGNLLSTLSTKKYSQKKSPHEIVFEGFKPSLEKVKEIKAPKVLLKEAVESFEDVSFKDADKKSKGPQVMHIGTLSCTSVFKAPSYAAVRDDTSKYMKRVHQDHVEFVDMPEMPKDIQTKTPQDILGMRHASDEWWDTIMFENVSNMLTRLSEKLESTELSLKLKGFLHEKTLSSVQVLHNFVGTTLLGLFTKIKNRRVLKTDDLETKNVIYDVLESPKLLNSIQMAIDFLMSKRDHLWIFQGNSIDDVIKNHFVISHVFLECLVEHIHDVKLLQYMVGHFVRTMNNNMLQEAIISQNMEALREKRKTELMDLYKANDEDRRLQMTLKTFGLDTWYNVGEELDGEGQQQQPPQEILVIDEPTKEFYNDQGENPDDDEEY